MYIDLYPFNISQLLQAIALLGQLANKPARFNVVILDACRDNPFQGQFKSSSRGLARLTQSSTSTLVAFAAAPGGVSNDGQGQYGTYTQYLLDHLATPGITLNQMFTRVRRAVHQATGGNQFPKEENGLLQDVYLAGQGVSPSPEPNPVPHPTTTPAPRPTPAPAPTPVTPAIEPTMKLIRGGTFMMGSPASEEGRDDDERQHRVTVGDFYMAQHEVTVGEFKRFVQASGFQTEAEKDPAKGCYSEKTTSSFDWVANRSWRKPGFAQNDQHPVVCVSWNDANAYVRWLSQETGKSYRLPTEAEWEYAARAGTTTARYWGDDPNQACRYGNVADQKAQQRYTGWTIPACNDSFMQTSPVGRYQANARGLQDVMGNVWEWTCSAYDKNYGGTEQRCASGSAGDKRSLRGGSWFLIPRFVRSAYRVRDNPTYRNGGVGFRLSRTP